MAGLEAGSLDRLLARLNAVNGTKDSIETMSSYLLLNNNVSLCIKVRSVVPNKKNAIAGAPLTRGPALCCAPPSLRVITVLYSAG